jgi:hypothetical protein
MIFFKWKEHDLPEHSIKAGCLKGRYTIEIVYYNQKRYFGFHIGKFYQYFCSHSNDW